MHPPETDRPAPTFGRSCLTVATLFFLYGIGSIFLLILPTAFIGPVFVIGGLLLFGLIGIHYLIWGRWLTAVLRNQKEDETDQLDTPDGSK